MRKSELRNIIKEEIKKVLKENDTFLDQAKILLKDINNDRKLGEWLFNQDFFVEEDGEPIPDNKKIKYLQKAGANNAQIKKILKIVHSED